MTSSSNVAKLILHLWQDEKLPIIEGLLLSDNRFIGEIRSKAKKIVEFNLHKKITKTTIAT